MEFVGILRVLWRHRLLVLLAVLVGCCAALALAYRVGFPPKLESRQYRVGIGSSAALVDTPRSQVVDLGGQTGASIASLAARASLLASLMTSSPIKDEIALRAGVAPDRLIAVPPSSGIAGAAVPGVVSGASVSASDPAAIILKASIPNLPTGDSPIIRVDTQAPDAEVAERLANQAIIVLRKHLSAVAGFDKVPSSRRVVVTRLGAARSTTVARGPSPTFAVGLGLLVFLLGCASIVGAYALAGGWRRAAELERHLDDLGGADAEPAPVIEAAGAGASLDAGPELGESYADADADVVRFGG